jgi:molybdate transport system ATP-binding protein
MISLSSRPRVPDLTQAIHRAAAEEKSLHAELRKFRFSSRNTHFDLEVNFRAMPGVTVIVGHSGAGKTTILRCIAGLCDPDEGRIAIGDRPLFDSARRLSVESARRRVAFVFQDLALFPHLSVRDNVTYGLRRLNAVEKRRRMDDILESFQIGHLCNRLPHEISGGEQQRVALARSLVTEPSILLLDEPLSSLDPVTKAGIIEDLRRWNEERRIPILYVTHDYAEVLALGDRVIALEGGRIAAQGRPDEVVRGLRREPTSYAAEFDNLFDATVIELRERSHTMVCRIAGTPIDLEVPMARLPEGAEVCIGIRAAEVMVASSQPAIVSECTVIRGVIKRLKRDGTIVEGRIACGAEFRVHLPESSVDLFGLEVSSNVWMMIGAQACHLVRASLPNRLKRLFVFICGGNTSRSPMAEAICNGEIARRLGVPLESLTRLGIRAVSAGLKARPGEPLSVEADNALSAIGVRSFEHRSSNLTHRLANKAEFIFCMTEAQRTELIRRFPEAASKIHCLNPAVDIGDPAGDGPSAFVDLAYQLRQLIAGHLDSLGVEEAA